ncbi:hypothetical protein [Aeromicrobium sp.]|uniref:hypothetical protein n=1 Tax=Aeromicrobium sp. TaxID=1871063 RepID=UPI0030C5C76C
MPRLVRQSTPALVILVILAFVAGCDPRSDPIIPRGAGFQQAANGELLIWFGEPCRDVVEVELGFRRDSDDKQPLTYVLRAPGYIPSTELPAVAPSRGSGITSLRGLTLGSPVPGLRAESPLPAQFDWRDFYSVELLVKTSGGQGATYLITQDLTKESKDHPGEFYVQDQGWFDKGAFTKADGGDFKAICSSINPPS